MTDSPDYDLQFDTPAPQADYKSKQNAEFAAAYGSQTPAGRNLADYDFELLLDRSGSMLANDCPQGLTRWEYARGFTVALVAKMVKYDTNGIAIVPFAGTWDVYEEIFNTDKVNAIFRDVVPDGSTNTAGVLQARIDDFFAARQQGCTKKRILFVVTDGEPSGGVFGQKEVARVIQAAAARLESPDDLSIQFLQVGDDKKAEEFLIYLDNNLGEPDIVDTIKFSDVRELAFSEQVDKAIDD